MPFEPAFDDWKPDAYLAFADQRLRPAVDLLAQVDVASPRRITDLGCGAGNVTALLRHRWADAQITALDSSPAMLDRARSDYGHLQVDWQVGGIGEWTAPEPQDLIFSNAALHWLGDHPRLFAHLMAQLGPGGVLAVQMPDQFSGPSHETIRTVARQGPWAASLRRLAERPGAVVEPGAYYEWLLEWAEDVNIWQTTYSHILTGENPVFNWLQSTVLKPYLDAVPEELSVGFCAMVAERLCQAYPKSANGRTVLAFQRLFIVAQKG